MRMMFVRSVEAAELSGPRRRHGLLRQRRRHPRRRAAPARPPGCERSGAACDAQTPAGRASRASAARAPHATARRAGLPCTISDECDGGSSTAARTRTCVASGADAGAANATCTSDADCGSRPAVRPRGPRRRSASPRARRTSAASASWRRDCLAGLGLHGGRVRALPPVGDARARPRSAFRRLWAGETCKDDSGATAAYFHVPRGSNDGDFYRLPFPNDVRLTNGKVSLAEAPDAGLGSARLRRRAALVRQPPGERRRLQRVPDDLLPLQRGSRPRTARSRAPGSSGGSTSPAREPRRPGLLLVGSTAGNHYICDNWIGVRPPTGQPAHAQGTRTRSSSRPPGSMPGKRHPGVAADLTALLSPAAPQRRDPAARSGRSTSRCATGPASAALRPVSTILDATVFTVGHADGDIGPKLAAAVAAAPRCRRRRAGSTARPRLRRAPRPPATARAPRRPTRRFDELHALVTLPIFQQGTEPYSNPPDGGLRCSAPTARPRCSARSRCACRSRCPRAPPMPAGGWPLVVYAHGTGRQLPEPRDRRGRRRLASVDDGAGGQATSRCSASTRWSTGRGGGRRTDSPDNLFYNFANPGAARGNPLQGAADQLSLFAFATGFDLARGPLADDAPRSRSARSRSGVTRRARPRAGSRCRTRRA